MSPEPLKKPRVYAFIDSQNLNLGVKSQGWLIDYAKLRLYLQNRYDVSRAFMFLGYMHENKDLYKKLRSCGFELVFKEVSTYRNSAGEWVTKGNIDAELVLHAAAIMYKNYDKAIIISGDGDFSCLIQYLQSQRKFKRVLVPNQFYSRQLKKFLPHVVRMDLLKDELRY